MSSHLTLPYEWVECVDLETCQRIVHDEKSAEVMNGYPQEWVQSMLGFTVETGEQSDTELIAFRNSEGELHRVGSPAIEWAGGEHVWYENGELHRLGGPVAVYADGFEMWYIRGKKVPRGTRK